MSLALDPRFRGDDGEVRIGVRELTGRIARKGRCARFTERACPVTLAMVTIWCRGRRLLLSELELQLAVSPDTCR
jgi:hypothetical protein